MHYKNGREAKAGDRIIHLPTGQGGVLHSPNAGSTTCNGRLAITTPNDLYITLSECLHADDIARATIPDSSNTVTNEDWNRQKKSGAVATVAVLLLSMLLGAGCKTGPDGKRSIDVIKLSQAKAMIEPAAAGALRRVLQNSPEHAPLIARYAASVAGVFCTMSLSNQFSPDFLISEADKFFDPALEKIGDGYVLDAKNAGVGIYRLLWGDRLRAEIPETNWLHSVCEFFCESINQGLTDAGFPGGVRKTAGVISPKRVISNQIYSTRVAQMNDCGGSVVKNSPHGDGKGDPGEDSAGISDLALARGRPAEAGVPPATWIPPGYVTLAHD